MGLSRIFPRRNDLAATFGLDSVMRCVYTNILSNVVFQRWFFMKNLERPVEAGEVAGGTQRFRKGKPPSVSALARKKLIAFGWYGGKFSHLAWLLPLLPPCHHYCQPFAGSAAVLLNRRPSPVETYNDLDGEVLNFFRPLRDQQKALSGCDGIRRSPA